MTVDVVIIGCGPAGLQAAVHAVRKKASVVVLGRPEASSIYRAHVENYLCVEGVAEGAELLAVAMRQAERFGARLLPEEVLAVRQAGERYEVEITSGETLRAWAVIFATGTSRSKLKVPGEKELVGRGVSYCVDCDANFFRGGKVAVVGNGSAAVDGALTLLHYADTVHLVAKELEVGQTLSRRLAESAVQVHTGVWVEAIQGDNAVTGLLLDNGDTLEVEGVFVELGAKGAMELATTLGVMLDTETFSHIATDKRQQTNLPGVYAAGDIAGPPYQMAKAVGEGCVAGWYAANYARKKGKEAGGPAERSGG